MQPSEVLMAAGFTADAQRKPTGIHLVDGGCVAVHCVDVYLVNANPFASQPVRYGSSAQRSWSTFFRKRGCRSG